LHRSVDLSGCGEKRALGNTGTDLHWQLSWTIQHQLNTFLSQI